LYSDYYRNQNNPRELNELVEWMQLECFRGIAIVTIPSAARGSRHAREGPARCRRMRRPAPPSSMTGARTASRLILQLQRPGGKNLGVAAIAISAEYPMGDGAPLASLAPEPNVTGAAVANAFGEGPGVKLFHSIVSRSWVDFTKLAVVLGVVYFLVARLTFFV